MSAVAPLPIARPETAHPLSDEILIGKDILELLTGAMYADPLTIYREYVQNAADSIDAARDADLPAGEGFGVTIALDRASRSVRIRDNGASIRTRDFVRTLTAIGASGKRNKNLRGFRGVGRLSGLGYCQEIFFRGRAEGDRQISELRWDGRKLRELLRDPAYTGDLSMLVRSAVEVRKFDDAAYPARFFEVELRKVSRLRGDLLLNDDAIRAYLAQVAPVPFHPDFALGNRIATFLSDRGVRAPIDIRIEGDTQPIFHGARSQIIFSEKLVDPIDSVEFIEFRGQDGDIDAFGWLVEHSYLGAVPRKAGFGGLRLRAGNIQVGNELILSPLYSEPRFATWAIGEIHVCSPRILPNGRRDEFEAGVHYAHLQDEMSILTKRITQTLRDRSIGRNRLRRVREDILYAEQWLDQARGDRLPPSMLARIRQIVDQRLQAAQKLLERLPTEREDVVDFKQRLKTAASRRTRLFGAEDTGRTKDRSAKDKALSVALSVVLEHARTPEAGLALSRHILQAFGEA